jgi:hypothetical protein
MDDGTRILPGLPAVAGKPVHIGFDGGRLTSDAGILLLAAVEQRLMQLGRWGEPPQNWQQDPVTLEGLRLQAGSHRLAAVVKSGMAQRFHILVVS